MKMNNFNNINNQMNNLNLFNMNNNMNNININNMNHIYQDNNINLNNMNMNFIDMNQINNMNMNIFNNNMNMINNRNNYMDNEGQTDNLNNPNKINQFNSINNNNSNNNINLKNNLINENSNNLFLKTYNFNKFLTMLEQTRKCICIVYNSIEKDFTIGVFCQVFYNNKKHKLLIAYINKELYKNDLIICYNEVNGRLPIRLNDQRNIYMNKKFNILIVEIKYNEEVDFFYEYNYDDSEDNSNPNGLNEKGNLLILFSSKTEKDEKIIEFSFGILKNPTENEINISFNYDKSFLGSPIINMTNNKLTGILSSSDKGITLKYILKDYFMNKNNAYLIDNTMHDFQHMNIMINQQIILQEQMMYNNYMDDSKNKNQIKIKVKVNYDDINREIKIINDLENIDKNDIELYINDIKLEYQNWFIASKEGIYYIKLIFKKNIKNCSKMFAHCNKILEIDLSRFDTKNVTNMNMMFYNCEILEEIDLSNFNTENVTDMECMFGECYRLKYLDVSSFNTKKVNNMYSMFAYTALNYLDLSSFDFNCNIMNIIGGTPLKEIKIKKNDEVEKELYSFIKYRNGKIITV